FGGVFSDNVVAGHTAYAALAFYGASDWTIARNDVDHMVATVGRRSHRFCDPGSFIQAPQGAGTAAIVFCQDNAEHYSVGNRVVDNRVRAFYGILSIGADDTYLRPEWTRRDWVPRRSRFVGNITAGSRVGCADDFQPGQWRHDDNVWAHNDCRGGRPDTKPEYF
ncbi:MAG: hypothetical protein LC640_13530, partial [Frankia sp.]|nr:hypothetical protein [Frankia sp.]